LNLNPRQRGRFQQAVQGGQGQQFMTDRPWLQQRINQLDPRSQQATNLQNFLGTGQPQPRPTTGPGVPAPTPQPPTRPPNGADAIWPGGWTGDNAAMQPGLAGAAGGPYAIGSGEMGPSFGPGGPYGGLQPMSAYGGNAYGAPMGGGGGGFPPRDLGDLHGMLGGGPAMQPQQQQRPGGMFGGYSPQMQQVLQARGYGGAGGGGMGGGGLASLGGGGFTGGNRGAGGLFGPYAGPVQQRRQPPTGGAGAAGGAGGVGGAGGTL
jgi:hypothetical protein